MPARGVIAGSVCDDARMGLTVHLIDGTYELFRQFFARPSHVTAAGEEVGATRAVVRSLLGLLEGGATHMGVATDHVIESFRNDLWPGYKTSAGMDPGILSQFPLLEDALEGIGLAVFAMVQYEADDALAAAAAVAAADPEVERVLICTPDKDLAQCVQAGRVLQLDRRADKTFDVAEVLDKFGVEPESIPDWLALVGDSADGFPGLPGWGAKSAAAVLRHYKHLEAIPPAAGQWEVTVRGGANLARTLADQFELALLFRRIATLERDAPTVTEVEELRWRGPASTLAEVAARLEADDLVERVDRLAATRR
jgi:5'-3' exonuclease